MAYITARIGRGFTAKLLNSRQNWKFRK